MTGYPIDDYDDAYDNLGHIAGSAAYPDFWMAQAGKTRSRLQVTGRAGIDHRYGESPRNLLDLFLPDGAPRGLAVFVHGGYWKAMGKDHWSWLAEGPLAHGFAVAIVQYTLCPDHSIGGIGREIAAALRFACKRVEGPVRLAGHSAGGQLITRLICGEPLLENGVLDRITGAVSISGVHDLRPLLRTAMNDILRLDEAEARAESPVLHEPLASIPVTAWVGADERPEFVRQNRLLYEMWRGYRTPMSFVEEPGRNHLTVIEGLADPEHALCKALVGA